jgi:hypothetical protein
MVKLVNHFLLVRETLKSIRNIILRRTDKTNELDIYVIKLFVFFNFLCEYVNFGSTIS